MSTEGYAVNLPELETTADKIAALVGFVEDSLHQVETRAQALRAEWSGDTAAAYDTAHRDWVAGIQDMNDGLLRMQEAAKNAHTNYINASQTNVAILGRGPAPENVGR
jgi:WXG100 family type VII secretion target